MRKILFFVAILFTTNVFAQTQTDYYFNLTRAGFNEKNAFKTTAFVEKYSVFRAIPALMQVFIM